MSTKKASFISFDLQQSHKIRALLLSSTRLRLRFGACGALHYKTRPALERLGRDASKYSVAHSTHFVKHETTRGEEEPDRYNSSDETRFGKLRARRMQRDPFDGGCTPNLVAIGHKKTSTDARLVTYGPLFP
eukprot:scaffold7197_cov66-Attheya_sp.AAC.4